MKGLVRKHGLVLFYIFTSLFEAIHYRLNWKCNSNLTNPYIFTALLSIMVELNLKKRRQMMGEYEYSEHSEGCGCESVTGIIEEDTQERE